MFIKKMTICLLLAIACVYLFISNSVYSADLPGKRYSSEIPYRPIEISALSRCSEDRIVFQHIQLPGSISYTEDNSFASLLVIKSDQVYLFRDGNDDAKKIAYEGRIQDLLKGMPKDLWVNKIDSKPDFVRIFDRRSEKMMNDKEEYVEKNFGDFYRNVRNAVIYNHVQIFKYLKRNRFDSDFSIQRDPIPQRAFEEKVESVKFTTIMKAKAMNNTYYYAEDKDGDDITETFYVTLDDGFKWGYKSGPNIIFIYNNQDEDIKSLIGQLCHDAYFGSSEEENEILKTFPKDTDIINAFKLEKVTVQASQPEKKTPAPAASEKK